MFRVKISNNGIISEITVNANDYNAVHQIVTNMFGSSNVQIIEIRRI